MEIIKNGNGQHFKVSEKEASYFKKLLPGQFVTVDVINDEQKAIDRLIEETKKVTGEEIDDVEPYIKKLKSKSKE